MRSAFSRTMNTAPGISASSGSPALTTAVPLTRRRFGVHHRLDLGAGLRRIFALRHQG
jgi:hypothetical protein